MKKLISIAKDFGPSVAGLLLPFAAFAQATPGAPSTVAGVGAATNISSVGSVLNFVCTVFGWAFFFLIALAVLFVIIAAFRYLTAAGDPEKVKAAGGTLLYAAIAIGVALLARAIPLIVGNFLAGNATGLSSC